jgi:MFS transporter, DHA2 family, multidrug resistance protein
MTSAAKPAQLSDTTDQGRYSQSPEPGRNHPDRLGARLLWIAAVCVVGAMPSLLDTTVVAVAQRTFISQFHSTQAIVAWTMTGYTLALAAVIPLTGWAADRFGTKRLFMGSIVLFTVGSLLCAMAPSISLLVVFRVLQGLGGGMVMPLVFTILTREAGPTRLARLAAVLGIPMLLGPVCGPILGGWLVDSYGWKSIFLINVPIGVLAVALAAIVFARDRPAPSESFDVRGVLLLSPGLATFLYGISLIPQRGTAANPHVWLSVTIGLGLIIGFVLHALRAEHPLIDMRLFANRVVRVANTAMLFFAAGFFGASLLLPSYFQQLLHQTPMQSGAHLIPQGIGAMLTMPVAAQVMDRRGPGRIVLVGILLTCAGMGIFAYGTWKQVAYAPVLAAGLAIIGMGMGCTFMTLSAAAVQTLKPEQVARGSTLINVTQRLGGSIGTALTSVILTNQFNRSPNVAAANKLVALHDEATKRGVPVPRSAIPPQAQLPDFVHNVTHDLSHSYTLVFLTVAVLVALTYIPAVLLPRRPVQEAAGQTAAPASAISEHQPRVGTTRVDPAGWQRHTGVGPGSAPVDAEYALLPAVGWRARFTGTSEVDTAEQQRWIGTIRVGRQGWEQPGAGRGGAPVYREYALPPAVGWRTVNGNGNGDARASFDGAGSADTAQQQRWIGTYRVDRQGWEQPGAGPVYRQSSLLPAVGWRARFRGIREAVAGMGRVARVPRRTRMSVGVIS